VIVAGTRCTVLRRRTKRTFKIIDFSFGHAEKEFADRNRLEPRGGNQVLRLNVSEPGIFAVKTLSALSCV